MVQLVEVEDEHFKTPQPGPDDEGDYTDTGTPPIRPLTNPFYIFCRTALVS
jgi:hypothetical protein